MPENVNTTTLIEPTIQDPNDERETMVKVDHVSMVFNMASERLNSLKEYAIQIARGKLFFEGFTALDDISFEVKKGDVFGILGTNGSGKSTILKIIAGVLEPSKGICKVNGNIAPLIELGAGFDMELSARENIYLNGALLGYSKAFINEHFDAIVEFAEIEKFLDMPLKNYSSGMVARIAFAIATVIVPEILVVDEVLSVGDFMFQRKCEDRISELIDKHGVTVLIVSHSNVQVERLCNKVIWIEKGHVRMMGDASSVCRLYDGLGGRSGSPEGEQRVLKALQCDIEDSETNSLDRVAGEDASGTAIQLTSRAWENDFNTAIVVCATTHINAVMASGLAGALSAPIFPTRPDRLPYSVEAMLRESKPSTIFFIDCGGVAEGALKTIKRLTWSPNIVVFADEAGNTFDLSLEIHRYGLSQNLWGNEIIFLDLADNLESFTATPLAYSMRCPVITTFDEPPFEPLKEAVKNGKHKKALIIGGAVAATVDPFLQKLNINTERVAENTSQKTCLEICRRTISYQQDQYGTVKELCVAALSFAQWPELLNIGPYAGRQKGALLLENTTDLDDISHCLDFVEREGLSVDHITLIGKESGLSPLDGELILSAFLASKQTSC